MYPPKRICVTEIRAGHGEVCLSLPLTKAPAVVVCFLPALQEGSVSFPEAILSSALSTARYRVPCCLVLINPGVQSESISDLQFNHTFHHVFEHFQFVDAQSYAFRFCSILNKC